VHGRALGIGDVREPVEDVFVCCQDESTL
jgi:hypothetical protein